MKKKKLEKAEENIGEGVVGEGGSVEKKEEEEE